MNYFNAQTIIITPHTFVIFGFQSDGRAVEESEQPVGAISPVFFLLPAGRYRTLCVHRCVYALCPGVSWGCGPESLHIVAVAVQNF